MSEQLAGSIVSAIGLYLGVGVLIALPFVWRGAGRLDPRGLGSGVGFRAILIPASVVLWPWLLIWWIRGSAVDERNAHRIAAERASEEAR
jgi:hypothetical protein